MEKFDCEDGRPGGEGMSCEEYCAQDKGCGFSLDVTKKCCECGFCRPKDQSEFGNSIYNIYAQKMSILL